MIPVSRPKPLHSGLSDTCCLKVMRPEAVPLPKGQTGLPARRQQAFEYAAVLKPSLLDLQVCVQNARLQLLLGVA